jgi:tetratricopeptide (TPR) repeat protein
VKETWQRWNDYGIGLLLTSNAQLKQATEAFAQVEKLNRFDGPLNLARVQAAEGNWRGATDSLARASKMQPPPPAWTMSWLSGDVARQQSQFEAAASNFRAVLNDDTQERRDRGFDFSRDYVVRNLLAGTYFDMAQSADLRGEKEAYLSYLNQAREEFETVLKTDSENVTAHAQLSDIFKRLGNEKRHQFHLAENLKYKPDDNAGDVGRAKAREKYPAANIAAEPLVIYSMQREGAPELMPNTNATVAKALP